MPVNKPVTVWVVWTPPETPKPSKEGKPAKPGKPGYWTFNHIEDGHSAADKPQDSIDRGWARSKWRRAHGQLGELGRWGAQQLEYKRDGLFDVES